MSDEIWQVQPQDSQIQEEWLWETSDSSVVMVDACRVDEIGGWQVTVSVMEYVNEDPLESELRLHITTALSNVTGVTSAKKRDREQWFVTGTPSGKALVEATTRALDDLAGSINEFLEGS